MRFGLVHVVFAWAVMAVLSGCASTPQNLTEGQVKQIKNVAIVNLVPERVNFEKIGLISFTSEHADFNLGDKTTESILFVAQQRIAKFHPEWTLKPIKYNQAELLAVVTSGFGMHTSRAKEVFANLARNHGVDALVVVRAAADQETDSYAIENNALREGLTVWFKNNELTDSPKLYIRANLNIAIIGNNGETMAMGIVPGKIDESQMLRAADLDLTTDMRRNLQPEILEKLGREVLLDLSRRLNLGFDALGFIDVAHPETQHVNFVPPVSVPPEPKVVPAPQPAPVSQPAPVMNLFDQCFARCRQYTDRTKEQCFDVCNAPVPRAQP